MTKENISDPNLPLTFVCVDTIYVHGLPRHQCDVEQIDLTHYKIYTTYPLSDNEKMEAINKFCSVDTTKLI